MKSFNAVCLLALCLCVMSAHAERVYYRYVNEEGVKVLDTSIPPKYAQKGYEIINQGGKVIEVVPPAPTKDQLAQQHNQKDILENYERLRKRYSSVDGIESARKRRLESLNTSISILKGNLSTLESQLQNQMEKAATSEREGKKVPVHILDSIANTKAELAVATELLELRLQEEKRINERFDKDIEYFVKGEALAQQGSASSTLPN